MGSSHDGARSRNLSVACVITEVARAACRGYPASGPAGGSDIQQEVKISMEKPTFPKKIATAIEKRHLAIVVLISLLHVGLAALPRLGRPLRFS